MDPNQFRDLVEMSSKLQLAFRHIKFLCGKYIEMENGGNPYIPPYPEYSFPPSIPFNATAPFLPQDSFYSQPPPYNLYDKKMQNGRGPEKQNIQPSNATNKAIVSKKVESTGIKPNINTKKLISVPQNGQRPTDSAKKPLTNLHQDQVSIVPKNSALKQIPTKQLIPSKVTLPQKSVTPTPYQIFYMRKKKQIKNEYPQLKENEINEIMHQVWASFKEDEKKPYYDEWEMLKAKAQSNGKVSTSEIAKSLRNQLAK